MNSPLNSIFLIVFFVFFIFSLLFLLKRDKIFSLYYILLFIYSFIPLLARFFYSDKIELLSNVKITNDYTIFKSILYMLMFMFFLFINYMILIKPKLKFLKPNQNNEITFNKYLIRFEDSKSKYIYIVIHVILILYLGIKLIMNFNLLNYYDQSLLKKDLIWVLALEFSFIFMLNDFFYLKSKKSRSCIKLLLIVLILISLITCFKIGNRGIFIPYLFGCIYILIKQLNIKKIKSFMKNINKIVLLIIVIIFLSQFIRVTRGHNEFNFTSSSFFDFFNPEVILFQDYAIPANSFFYIMDNRIINPIFVLYSTIGNGIFFFDYKTIALFISRLVLPNSWWGIGGYQLAESYMAFGFFGSIICPFLVIYIYKIYYKFLFKNKTKQFQDFIAVIFISTLMFNLVRGQMYFLFKSLYMYIIPSILLFCLLNGGKLYKKRRAEFGKGK